MIFTKNHCFLIVVLFIIFFTFLKYFDFSSFSFISSSCLPSPFLYVTFHSNLQGVRKYSRNGCFLRKNILTGKTKYINEARSVSIGRYSDQKNALFVSDARYNHCTRSCSKYSNQWLFQFSFIIELTK